MSLAKRLARRRRRRLFYAVQQRDRLRPLIPELELDVEVGGLPAPAQVLIDEEDWDVVVGTDLRAAGVAHSDAPGPRVTKPLRNEVEEPHEAF
jgi:hypothetical protein